MRPGSDTGIFQSSMGNSYNPELSESIILNGTNYVDWKQRMCSIPLIRGYHDMVTGVETIEKCKEQEKLDPDRKQIAYAIISLNFNVKIASQFDHKCDLNPTLLWDSLEKFYLPKTVQNQATYLNRIFSTTLSENNLNKNLDRVQELTRNLCTLINDKSVKPSVLLDSVVALWVVINLPSEYKMIGEMWLKECKVKKRSPTLDEAIEEIRCAIQRNEENQEKQAFLAKKKESEKTDKPWPTCKPGYHNPLTKHSEDECRNLKKGKSTTALICCEKEATQNSIVLDSGASNSMFNDSKYFIDFSPREDEVILADGSSIKTLGTGTIHLDLPHSYLKIRNCLLIPQLSVNLLSMATFIQANHSVRKSTLPKSFKVIGPNQEVIIEGSLESGNFVVTQNKATAFAVDSISQTTMHLHQASGHPSYEYFKRMYPNRRIPLLNCSTSSVSGSKYFLRVMDRYSHFVWIFFLTNKSQCISLIKTLVLKLKRQSNFLVSNIVSDNGTEFKNNELTTFYQQKGISHLTSAPYTPEQNRFAKRGNHTTVSKSRCLLKDSGLGMSYWAKAENTAVYLENLTPNKAINFQTPYFKCQKGELGIFIGYGQGHQTYRILNLETGNVKISHNVKFNDNIFPDLSYPDSNKTDTFTISDNLYLPVINPNVKTSNISHPTKINPTQNINTPAGEESESQIQPIDKNLPIESTALDENTTNQTDLPKFKGYIWTNEPINKTKEIHSANFSELSLLDPKNYKQAINSVESKNWEQAISQELQNMAKHSVWSPCNEPNNCKPLTTTWVFKRKTDEDGNLTKFKARLCVQGFNQREGIDYDKGFSPTAPHSLFKIKIHS
ncbi:hypothetical protein O181_018966 [Austropuccinia psidii MF-1]|uniref:Integrase catalytic domain-containing protein n=1 Tax=Austropuccinia psidii MF-1 TaxID=1389203 RepID=A0A9Q3C6A0_9BASI|nr:hypothetical protein [Austropuccinia psidii MF-1]